MDKIRTAIIGAGKMGEIHSKVYDQIAQSKLTAIVDSDFAKAQQLAKKYGCQAFADASELIGKVDAVTIAAPTIFHWQLAKMLIENKIPVLIEKPIAASAQQARDIVELSKQHNVIVAVGHSERCNPVVQAMKRLDIQAKFIEAHRISPYPFRSTDIGVVLDVMIHDLDIILSLANDRVKKVDAVGISVVTEGKEDICNARITFERGCVANVTASRLALKTERKVRVFSKTAYLSLDFFKKTGTIVKAEDNEKTVAMIKDVMSGSKWNMLKMTWSDLVHMEQLKIDDKEPLRVEQESFLDAVMGKVKRPEVVAEEGLAAMECAEMILESVREHKWE
jgi:predicted dehydrogenase